MIINPKKTAFSQFFKNKRIEKGLTLRQFCQKYKLDPGNISKLERGLLPPPISHEKLEQYAHFLGLKKGSDDWYEFFDLAAACKGRIPREFLKNEEIVKRLPIVFRTLRGQKVPSDQLEELVKKLTKT